VVHTQQGVIIKEREREWLESKSVTVLLADIILSSTIINAGLNHTEHFDGVLYNPGDRRKRLYRPPPGIYI